MIEKRAIIRIDVSRSARVGLALLAAWFTIYVILRSSANRDLREFAELWGLLIFLGPFAAIAVLTVLVWISKRTGHYRPPRPRWPPDF
jgi:hypothetical protein